MARTPCCFCQGPLLYLEGQATHFDTYNCMKGDDDLIAAGAFGKSHFPCLIASGWATRWTERWIGRMRRSGWREVGTEGEYNAFHWPNGDPRTCVFRMTGEAWEFSDREDLPRELDQSNPHTVVHPEYNIDLSEYPGLAQEIQHQLIESGEYSLLNLIERMGFVDKLLNRDALLSGRLRFQESLQEYWAEDWVCCEMRYDRYVPSEVWRLIQLARQTCGENG